MSASPVKLLLSIALVPGLLIGCAHQSHLTASKPERWPFAVRGQLADSEVEQVVAVIQRIPKIDRQIAWIEVESPNSIQVYTGRIYGPLAGGGNVVTMKKQKGRWTVIGDPQMSAWNA